MKIENFPDLKRDERTKAVLSSDAKAIAAYRKRKARFDQINTLEERIASLEALLKDRK